MTEHRTVRKPEVVDQSNAMEKLFCCLLNCMSGTNHRKTTILPRALASSTQRGEARWKSNTGHISGKICIEVQLPHIHNSIRTPAQPVFVKY